MNSRCLIIRRKPSYFKSVDMSLKCSSVSRLVDTCTRLLSMGMIYRRGYLIALVLNSLTAFNIHKEPERFIHMIIAYVMMSDKELGLNTFIKRDNGDRFITVVKDATGKERRL